MGLQMSTVHIRLCSPTFKTKSNMLKTPTWKPQQPKTTFWLFQVHMLGASLRSFTQEVTGTVMDSGWTTCASGCKERTIRGGSPNAWGGVQSPPHAPREDQVVVRDHSSEPLWSLEEPQCKQTDNVTIPRCSVESDYVTVLLFQIVKRKICSTSFWTPRPSPMKIRLSGLSMGVLGLLRPPEGLLRPALLTFTALEPGTLHRRLHGSWQLLVELGELRNGKVGRGCKEHRMNGRTTGWLIQH